MQFNNIKMVGSFPRYQLCPKENHPDFAFIGRSNVGKSSLINMLTGRKKLAHTSGTPGKTQLINYYRINDEWHLVDLPGYGYAKVSKTERKRWEQMIHNYLLHRHSLVVAFILVDINVPPQSSDLEMIRWMGEARIPFALIFTKGDRISATKRQKNIETYNEVLGKEWETLPTQFVSAAHSGLGRDEILEYISRIIGKL